jgi:predicted SnoaL-like aldol condensation-catalyzing enzyme
LHFKPKSNKMKHILLSFAVMAAIILASCNNSGTSTTNETTGTTRDSTASTEEQNLEKNRSVYKAIESGDSATIRSVIADDAVDHQGPNGSEIKGGAEITRWLTDMHNHVKDLKFDVISDAARGDYIFAMVDMKGTAADNSMGMPQGSDMGGKSVDVIKVKDGKMVEHWGFLNWTDVMKMMKKPGNMPQKK